MASIFFIQFALGLVRAPMPARAPSRLVFCRRSESGNTGCRAPSSGDAMTVKAIHHCVERLDFSGKEIFRSRSCSEVIVKSLVRQFAQPVLFCSRLNPIFSEANGGDLQRAAICRQRFFLRRSVASAQHGRKRLPQSL
jgi:hypothetical protein